LQSVIPDTGSGLVDLYPSEEVLFNLSVPFQIVLGLLFIPRYVVAYSSGYKHKHSYPGRPAYRIGIRVLIGEK